MDGEGGAHGFLQASRLLAVHLWWRRSGDQKDKEGAFSRIFELHLLLRKRTLQKEKLCCLCILATV